MGTLPPDQQGGLASMTLHELITLMILLIGTSRTNEIQYMKYTSEYILKLQLCQHSLLTRNVFSRHQSSAQFFITGSSLDHHQVWIITGSSSSLLPLSRTNGAISQFYSSQEVLQSQPFFMLVVGPTSM